MSISILGDNVNLSCSSLEFGKVNRGGSAMIVSLGDCDLTVLASDKYHYAVTMCGCIVLKFFC